MELVRSNISKEVWFKQGHRLGIKYKEERKRQLKRLFKTCFFSVPCIASLLGALESFSVRANILYILLIGFYGCFVAIMLVCFIQMLSAQRVEVEVLEGYVSYQNSHLVIADKHITGIPRKARDILETAWGCMLFANSEDLCGTNAFRRIDCFLEEADYNLLEKIDGEYNLYTKIYRTAGERSKFVSMELFISKEYAKPLQVFPNKFTKQ